VKPIPLPWLRLIPPYRKGDWHECVELLRPLVERHPDDLGSRLILASLLLRTGESGLAQVQYEKALPLAVGQNDLFRALAAQKCLDRLRPASGIHPKRFVAIHQWFSALSARSAPDEGRSAILTPALLLKLPPALFHRMAEESEIEEIGLEPLEIEGESDVVRVVLHGRLRWSITPDNDSTLIEVVADELEAIAVPAELALQTKLKLVPELPCACLRLRLPTLGEITPKPEPPRPAAPKRRTPAPPSSAAAPAGAEAPDPGLPAEQPDDRPVPDPVLEPLVASAAPFERRRETRVSVAFDTRVALLGVAGSRVAPFVGRLINLSPAGIGVAFSRSELRSVRELLQGALITIEVRLPGDNEPLRLAGRVRWVEVEPETPGAPDDEPGRVGLEFILLGARDRTRIQEVLIVSARSGRPLEAGAGVAGPAQGGPAAPPARRPSDSPAPRPAVPGRAAPARRTDPDSAKPLDEKKPAA
jgi:hypothetical protein